MAELIARVRDLIGDDAGANQALSDQQIQGAMDRHRIIVRYAELRGEATRGSGTVTYLDYYSEYGDWEADEKLYNAAYDQLAPATADRLTGHWTFATSTPGPVYIVGKSYDVYGAAADLLEQWATRLALKYDVTDQGSSYKRSQMAEGLLRQARAYRSQQRVQVIQMDRSDAL